jgi:hypothetical protein
MEYVLTLILINGQQRELLLDKPHVLVPSPNDPKAVSWTDRDGLIHNVPWSSIIELYFSPEDFNACRLASLEQNKQLKEIK